MSAIRLVKLGDACISLQLSGDIDPVVNDRCIAVATALDTLALRGVRDVVPTYNAVTVHFDPRAIDRQMLASALDRLAAQTTARDDHDARSVEIPVSYGGTSGPDLSAVAEFAKCSEAEVIHMHSGVRYRVYMLGFLPGFAYLGSVDRRIAMPRFDTPRARVAAGSVGIAGEQTGIYPCDTPGGWRVIGRTASKVFDAARSEPFLLKAGDYVTFVAA